MKLPKTFAGGFAVLLAAVTAIVLVLAVVASGRG